MTQKMNRAMNKQQIAQLIDISAVRADSTWSEIEQIIEASKKYPFICIFTMPSMIEKYVDAVKSLPQTGLGGIVGFPSGGDTTTMKVAQAKELVAAGCDEVDMVMNIGKLKSGFYDEVRSDILAVKEAVAPLPLKVIMEVCLLSDEEIGKASEIIRDCGVAYLKTGTGWAGATTMHHIDLIKQAVGDTIPLKVAGGVRDLNTLLEMKAKGVSRFGIGYKSAIKIMEECE